MNAGMADAPPVARIEPSTQTLHGRTREDPYAWLRVENWQEVMRNPGALADDVRTHLEAENAYCERFFEAAPELRSLLFEEMRARIKEDDSSVPEPHGPFSYYTRYEKGGQHPIFCRRDRAESEGTEEVLLDGDAEAKGHAFWQLGGMDIAPDHGTIAFATDLRGSEIYSIRFRRVGSDEDMPDLIEGTNGNFTWAEDGQSIFYTVLDDNHRPSKVMRHVLGTDPGEDALVYEEPDPGFFVGVGLTESRRFIVIDAHDHVTSEIRLVDARSPDRAPFLVRAREPGVEYELSHHSDHLLIKTNIDGAEDFKIMRAPVSDEETGSWEEWVPHQPGRLLASMSVYARHLVRLELVDALPRIVVRDMDSGEEHIIAFDEEAYSLSLLGSLEFDTDRLRFSYSSMTTPSRVFDYDMRTRQRVLRKEQTIPSGHDPSQYVVRRIFARSHDGEMVPVSILARKDTPLDGTAPALLYGYGSYGHTIPASFGTARLSLVDRGFVFAIAHVRGGMERGYRWYRDGRGRHKTNTFKDFIAAAEALVAEGFSAKGKIGAQGGSAGGMLMGAAANLRPDLFGAIVAEVPFVDVLTTMSDATLPLTPPEWPEWGNPLESVEDYATIAAYSPYDNVSAQTYPPILATAGLTDPRVTYWEPAKWVARLRAVGQGGPIFLKTNMEAGHGGAAGRFQRLGETALVHAFLIMILKGK